MGFLIFVLWGLCGPLLLICWRRNGRAVTLLARVGRFASLGCYSEEYCLWVTRLFLLGSGVALTLLWLVALGWMCISG